MSRPFMSAPTDCARSSRSRTDVLLLAATALCVGGLAVVAGAVSFAHMRELATHHGQPGLEVVRLSDQR
jgi:hypothetical protein